MLLQPKLFHRIFGNYSSYALLILSKIWVNGRSQCCLQPIEIDTLKTDVLTYGEEVKERMRKSSDAKVKPLSRGKRKDLDRSKVEEQETTFLVVLDIMCMATYTAAKCQRAKSARHVAIHAAVCTRMLSRAGRLAGRSAKTCSTVSCTALLVLAL